MSTTKIADKTTLDNVYTDTTSILSRGGAKSNGNGELLVYNPSTNTWDTISGGGETKPIITVPNKDMGYTGSNVTITDLTSEWTTTVVMPNESSVSVEVPYIGTNYVISINVPDIVDFEIEINSNGNYIANNKKMISFSTSADAEIKAILDAYYNNEISWDEIGWKIGDTRIIHINEMQAPNPDSSNTWEEQDIAVSIIAHDHTDLATPINGHSKACITVQTREILSGTTANTIGGIHINGINDMSTTFTKWANLYMRTYLNSTVLDAIPDSDFKSCIKPSKHYRHTSYNTTVSELVTDTLFLPSYPEINGTEKNSYYLPTNPSEGSLFEYYNSLSNKIKFINNNGVPNTQTIVNYWTSSASSYTYYSQSSAPYGYRYYWMYSARTGSYSSAGTTGTSNMGLAPAFAM